MRSRVTSLYLCHIGSRTRYLHTARSGLTGLFGCGEYRSRPLNWRIVGFVPCGLVKDFIHQMSVRRSFTHDTFCLQLALFARLFRVPTVPQAVLLASGLQGLSLISGSAQYEHEGAAWRPKRFALPRQSPAHNPNEDSESESKVHVTGNVNATEGLSGHFVRSPRELLRAADVACQTCRDTRSRTRGSQLP
jgi:hypothetical protein